MIKYIAKKIERSKILCTMLYALGIPGTIRRMDRKLTVLHGMFIITRCLLYLHSLSAGIHYLISWCSSIDCTKLLMSFIIVDLSTFAHWYFIYKKRHLVKDVLQAIKKFERGSRHGPVKVRFCFECLAITFLVLSIVVFGMMFFLLYSNNMLIDEWIQYLNFDKTIHLSYIIELVYVFIEIMMGRIFRNVIPLLMTLLYIYCCLVIRRLILQSMEQLNTAFCSLKNTVVLEIFIRNYQNVHDIASMAESAFSETIFFLLICHFFQVFIIFSRVLGLDKFLLNPILQMENSVFGSLQSVAFFALTHFASQVSKADEDVRENVKNAAFRLSLQKNTKNLSEMLVRFMKSKRHLVLTAWEVFYFKRSFLFASTGVVITYNLLILQHSVRRVGWSETFVMPAVAIETVIIIIVVVSFAVLAAVVFALYWLWRLLLEDRRCARLGSSAFQHEWQRQSLGPLEDGPQRALLGSRGRNPRISRREMFVDERSRRMVKAPRCVQCPQPQPAPVVPVPAPARIEEPPQLEVVVLDGTEPPPPYEETVR